MDSTLRERSRYSFVNLAHHITGPLTSSQLIFAIVVLGVSAHLASEIYKAQDRCDDYRSDSYCDYVLGRLPESSAYAAFTGAFGTLAAIVGFVAAFVSAIPWVVAMVFDSLAAIFFLAGGIVSNLRRVIMSYIVSNSISRTRLYYAGAVPVMRRSAKSGPRVRPSCSSASSSLSLRPF